METQKINPLAQVITIGVREQFNDLLSYLALAVVKEFNKQPDIALDGGNDKEFFSFNFKGVKLFVARNEVNGLTIMLPEEY